VLLLSSLGNELKAEDLISGLKNINAKTALADCSFNDCVSIYSFAQYFDIKPARNRAGQKLAL
jgi:hypothetical protein